MDDVADDDVDCGRGVVLKKIVNVELMIDVLLVRVPDDDGEDEKDLKERPLSKVAPPSQTLVSNELCTPGRSTWIIMCVRINP